MSDRNNSEINKYHDNNIRLPGMMVMPANSSNSSNTQGGFLGVNLVPRIKTDDDVNNLSNSNNNVSSSVEEINPSPFKNLLNMFTSNTNKNTSSISPKKEEKSEQKAKHQLVNFQESPTADKETRDKRGNTNHQSRKSKLGEIMTQELQKEDTKTPNTNVISSMIISTNEKEIINSIKLMPISLDEKTKTKKDEPISAKINPDVVKSEINTTLHKPDTENKVVSIICPDKSSAVLTIPNLSNKIVNGVPSLPGVPSIGLSINTKTKPKKRPIQNMKPLYWIVIDSRKIKDSIWEKLDDSKIEINAIKFEDEFSVKKTVTHEHVAKVQANYKPSMLLPGRQQIINIVLIKLKIAPITIVEALLAYDEKVLTLNVVDLLIPIVPNENEIQSVDAYDGDPMTLAESDQFVLMMATTPGYEYRLKAIIFKSLYKEEIELISKKVDGFIETFNFIKNNKSLHKWLEIILAYGNYLNGISNRGGAFAFKLDILTKLTDIKSGDNKKTLLFYLVEFIQEILKDEKLLEITNDLVVFSKMSVLDINDSFKELNQLFLQVKSLDEIISKQENLEEDDHSKEFLASFYDNACLMMYNLTEKIKSIEVEYNELIKYFADSSKEIPLEMFIEIFNKFYKDLLLTKTTYFRNKELKEKMEKKKTIVKK